MKKESQKWSRMSSEAVKAKTGKSWEEWIKALDKEKAFKLPHKEIAIIVSKKFGVSDWWSQTVTVGYEQAKGLRALYEKTGGFAAGISKTFNVPVATVYDWWIDDLKRKHWLTKKITIHKATKNKSLRITWTDGKKSVSVNFYPKGKTKSNVQIQQEQLKDEKAVVASKDFWKESLKNLELVFSN